MAQKKKLTDEEAAAKLKAAGGKGNRGAIHAASRARRAGRYKMHPAIAERNKARRVRQHVRSHPADIVARHWLEQHFADPEMVGLSPKGRRLSKRYKAEARKRHQQEQLI